jgi:hypothetical protein
VTPIALAVDRLMTSSNWVGCTTGISAGFSPLRTRPVLMPASRLRPMVALFFCCKDRYGADRSDNHGYLTLHQIGLKTRLGRSHERASA